MSKMMKPAAFQETPRLSPEASRELLQYVGKITLSPERRQELQHYTQAAKAAFARPLATNTKKHGD